ncbi:MFS transporter, sugar porter (SP) family [Actinopolymorpha cephalotaxi]|uniref:MFS transporter, sugar porter (SP) family n=1 Tax=Actinopolymorpha cephalotaxi TaxID=504797 RepID=A0A1I2VCA7_9ACTN|nr:sugar porter family MFS transporter [Actinopolymorpha cephalotaxi]NYH84829.1 sugar porter (SP) family MFS transporter [Actinopolymorpha cephalotaxi]SFG86862.1 MFS transporter, sugar porter (SP) family [Actinopolymorpha cephalotaxi]
MSRADPDVSGASSAGGTGHTVLVAMVAALGGFLFGYDTAVINGAVAAVRDTFHASPGVLGFAVAAALLGSALGAWFAGPLAGRMGRIRVMVIAAVLFLVSAVGSGFSFSIWDLAVWRFVGGMGVGAASVIAPAYIAEISPARIRGRLGSLQQLAIVTGIFMALLVDFGLVAAAGGATSELWFGLDAWRWMFLSLMIPALAYGILALQIPESPRYLVARKRLTEAREVLVQYVGGDVDAKIVDIQRTLGTDRRSRLGDLRGPRLGLLPIVWVGILLSVFQQFVGINVIFYYSSVLWQAVGFSEQDSLVITVITSVTNIVTTLIAIATIDRIGRKPLLLIGSAGMIITLGTLAFAFGTAPVVHGKPVLEGVMSPLALVAANIYVVFFGLSWGPVVWVLLGEMFNNRIRAQALAVAAAAQWLANFAVSTTFPVLQQIGLGFAYGLYTLFAILSFLFVARAVRETKGRELESM